MPPAARLKSWLRVTTGVGIAWLALSLFVLPAEISWPGLVAITALALTLSVARALVATGPAWERWRAPAFSMVCVVAVVALGVWRFGWLEGDDSSSTSLRPGDCFLSSTPGIIPALGAEVRCDRADVVPSLREVPLYRVSSVRTVRSRGEFAGLDCGPGETAFLTSEESQKLGRDQPADAVCAAES